MNANENKMKKEEQDLNYRRDDQYNWEKVDIMAAHYQGILSTLGEDISR